MPLRAVRYRMRRAVSAYEPRKRLIEAGLELFGKYSFDGARTRMLARRAQVNLAAITYYFGGKQGLYLAVAGHIAEEVEGLLGPRLAKVQEALKTEALSKEQSFHLLCDLLEFLVSRFIGHTQTEKWLSIIVREQLSPTEAFGILFEGFMKPLNEALFGLAAHVMGQGPDDHEVKLRVLAILGGIQIFNISPSTVKRTLNWESYEPENLEAIRCVIVENLKRIFSISSDGPYASKMGGTSEKR